MSEQSNEDVNLTVSKVYETLQTPQFLNHLYWDVLSDIKDKSSFKQMREIVEKIIKKKTDVIETLLDSSSDLARKNIIAEICSMTYAVDALFSKILHVKLEKLYKKEIVNIMKELKNEGNLPEEISSKIQISSNSSSDDSSEKTALTVPKVTIQQKETQEVPPVHEKRKQNDISCGEGSSTLGNQTSITENIVNSGTRRKLSKKDIEDSIKASKAITKKTVSTPNTPKKDLVVSNASSFSTKTGAMLESENEENEDSDAESEISVGHLSIASVSSVHTSDLSSFDDEISVGSDEEGSKKRLSLKYLQQICENGTPKLDKISNGIKPKKLQKEIKNNLAKENNIDEQKEIQKTPTKKTKVKTEIQISPVRGIPNTPESTSSELSTSVVSKRIRKPNTRYSSDSIVCRSVKVKERKKQPVSPKNTSEKNSSNENSPTRKRLRSDSSEVETPNKMQKLDTSVGERNMSNVKRALELTKSSDLCKPQSSVRPLTSRRTAPVTLYSTN